MHLCTGYDCASTCRLPRELSIKIVGSCKLAIISPHERCYRFTGFEIAARRSAPVNEWKKV